VLSALYGNRIAVQQRVEHASPVPLQSPYWQLQRMHGPARETRTRASRPMQQQGQNVPRPRGLRRIPVGEDSKLVAGSTGFLVSTGKETVYRPSRISQAPAAIDHVVLGTEPSVPKASEWRSKEREAQSPEKKMQSKAITVAGGDMDKINSMELGRRKPAQAIGGYLHVDFDDGTGAHPRRYKAGTVGHEMSIATNPRALQ